MPHSLQLQTLVTFWQESLSKQRILTKLRVKQQQSFSANVNSQVDTMRTTTSLPSKLSDKEKWLLNYLQGTDSQQLLTLGKESTTRNYGELAMIEEGALAQEICRFLKLDPQSQEFTPTPPGRDKQHSSSHPNAHPSGGNSHLRRTHQSGSTADYHAGAFAGHHHPHHQQSLPESQQRAMYSMQGSRAQLDQGAKSAQASRNQSRPTLSQTNSMQPADSATSGSMMAPPGTQGVPHGNATMPQ